jgi:hypothetical protein
MQGRFPEAVQAYRLGHALGSKRPGWRYPSALWVRQAERLVALDRRLPAVLRGAAEPAGAAERLEFASLCRHPARRLHAAAARLAADAFAEEPKLGDDLNAQHRYNAACSAALAATGQGADAHKVPDKARLPLRRQALRWLQADLARYAKFVQAGKPALKQAVRQRLAHWQGDADLVSVRAKDALAELPGAEADAWRKLWAEVDALRKRAGR